MGTRQFREKDHGFSGAIRLVLSAMLPLTVASGLWAATGTLDRVSGWYPAGTNIAVTATPVDVYSRFERWDGDTNDALVVTNSLTVPVLSGPRVIRAVFVDSTTSSNAVPYTWLNALSNSWDTTVEFESAVTNDHDGDGFTTAQEYWSGTDPFSDTSYLHISDVAFENGNIRLYWNHARIDSNILPLGVQIRTNLMIGSWQDASPNTNAPVDGVNTWEQPYPGPRFYRLLTPVGP